MTSQHPIIRRHAAARFAPLLLILAALLAAAPGALAQDAKSPAQLRRENDALRERIRELEAQVEQANEQIDELAVQVADLKASLDRRGAMPQGTAPAPIDPTPGAVPDDRFACPDALQQWLAADYAHSFQNIPVPSTQPLRYWVRRTKLERSTVLWDVRLLHWEPSDPSTAKVIAFDWETGENRCEPFRMTFNDRDAEIIRASPELREWTIEGVFAAEPVIVRNGDPVPDPKDLIGPSVRFGWAMTVRSIEPFQADNPDRGVAR